MSRPRRVTREIERKIRSGARREISTKEIAQKLQLLPATVRPYICAYKKGYGSLTAYRKAEFQRKGYRSQNEYLNTWAQQKGYASWKTYRTEMLQRRGYASRTDYEQDLARERMQRPENKEISDFITKRLQKLKRSQKWLAEQIGVSATSISYYQTGINCPPQKIKRRIFEILGALEEIVQEAS